MPDQLQDLLQKEVSRKEFLHHIGIGLVSLMGLGAILKLAGYKGHSLANHGYGSSPYGR